MEYEEKDSEGFEKSFPFAVACASKKAAEIGWTVYGLVFECGVCDDNGGESQWYHFHESGTIFVKWSLGDGSDCVADFQEDI